MRKPEKRHAFAKALADGFVSVDRIQEEDLGISRLTLGPPLRDEDYLTLSTIHSAKGQEWRHVFVLSCVDGCIPSDLGSGSSAEIEEERRLLYVAMTRARDALHLVVPQTFCIGRQASRGNRHVYASAAGSSPMMLAHASTCGRGPASSRATPLPRARRWRLST
jgi:superfamily I DNA/RNA helicase